MSDAVVTIATDAGMLALWRGSAFADVDDYDDWERRITERLGDAIALGELVPIGIGGDGAFGVRIAVAPDGASERELQHTVVTSEAYLLAADDGPIFLSGIENVGVVRSASVSPDLPPGQYSVRISLIAWDEEPGARGPDGRPTPEALADFLIGITPGEDQQEFRKDEATFDPPPAV
jgi:hypothetical protein